MVIRKIPGEEFSGIEDLIPGVRRAPELGVPCGRIDVDPVIGRTLYVVAIAIIHVDHFALNFASRNCNHDQNNYEFAVTFHCKGSSTSRFGKKLIQISLGHLNLYQFEICLLFCLSHHSVYVIINNFRLWWNFVDSRDSAKCTWSGVNKREW